MTAEPQLDEYEPLPYVEGPENDHDTPKPKTPKAADDA
jgi:hypothetical protein